jgi:hypothetical protein
MARGLGLHELAAATAAGPAVAIPSRRRQTGWWLEPADLSETEAGLYPAGRPAANIMKAMSLVPEEVRSFFYLVSH